MISHGAITVINAIPCGIGATVGVELTTKAIFKVRGDRRTVDIINDTKENTEMARICVRNTYEHFRIEEPKGWSLEINSQIPISRGLKSSSSACNAIVSSVAGIISRDHGKGFDATEESVLDMIRLGVRCAREANVTVTGAFDDACGCHLGGLVITDNRNDMLIGRSEVDIHDVILLVPDTKIRKPSLDVNAFRKMADASRELVNKVDNDWYSVLTANGELIARAAGINDSVAKRAISMGAKAAGVSGTGPAISVVVGKNEGRTFLKDLEHNGYEAIITRTR
ncbi:MAG: shikimate kinase [Methanomassiliicoccaceae archaeon]|jgi:shikimate kinase|nr:shikimate kinase [Methanomassiliicoccaceae archaeon]